MKLSEKLNKILSEGKDGFMYKGFWVDTSGAYSAEGEPQVVVFTPDVERYFDSVDAAKKFLNDKRQIRSIKRRTGKAAKKSGLPF